MENVCRLCARPSSVLESVFGFENGRLISDLIAIICPVKIDVNDNLPKKICDECMEIIISATKLRETSVRSDLNFRLGNFTFPPEPPVEEKQIQIKQEFIENPFDDPFEESPPHQDEDYFEEPPRKKYAQRRKPFNSDHLCIQCNKRYVNLNALIKHMRTMHQLFFYRPYKCSICGEEEWTKDRIVRHRMNHHEGLAAPPFICDLCPVEEVHKITLEDHMLTSHLTDRSRPEPKNFDAYVEREKSFHCPICDYQTSYASNFRRHVKMRHNREISISSSGAGFSVMEQIRDKYECRKCFYTTAHQNNFCRHVKNCDPSNQQLEDGPKAKPKMIGPTFQCVTCSYKTCHQSNYRRHVKTRHNKVISMKSPVDTIIERIESVHQGVKYPCDRCPAVLASRVSLRRHIECCHLKVKSFVCDACGATYSDHNALKDHVRKVHLGIIERKFPCKLCSLKFRNSFTLKRHLLTHTGEVSSFLCFPMRFV